MQTCTLRAFRAVSYADGTQSWLYLRYSVSGRLGGGGKAGGGGGGEGALDILGASRALINFLLSCY